MSTNLEVHVASGDALDVRHFTVEEKISALFDVTLSALCENADVDFDAAVGKDATFTLHTPQGARSWSGLCRDLHQVQAEETGLSTYRINIVPTLWLATQRRNHRIFQHLSELDIVEKLLGEWGIEPKLKLDRGSFKKRKYKVQYGESDYAFMCRMLEDVGISFFFEQEGSTSKLVLTDAPQKAPPRSPAIKHFDNQSRTPGEEWVRGLDVGQQIRPGKYTVRDHDYRKPPTYPLIATAAGGAGVEQMLERFHYNPGAFLFRADKGDDSPVADDKGATRTDEKEGAAMAQRRLAAKRSTAKRITFRSNVFTLAPGIVVRIGNHPRGDVTSDAGYLILETHVDGEWDADWKLDALAVSASQPFYPPSSTKKPKTQGVESATVVGAPGDEIHTDEFGRIRVQFHWDREGKQDDNSSCWIHVSQPWGGTGYGGTNLPRVGQEVLVDFLGGDPDRPIVVGRVYTNLQKKPYKLPDNKTQSGWKSNSTNNTGGYNEIMFEDAAGKELVRMQAEKDLHKLVKHDEQVTVGRDRGKLVKRNDDLTVGKNRRKRIVENETVNVGINRTTKIGKTDSTTAGEKHVVTITPQGGGATTTTHTDGKIVFTTGKGATITMQGSEIWISAALIHVVSEKGTEVGAKGGDVFIHGGPWVKINPKATPAPPPPPPPAPPAEEVPFGWPI